MSDITHTLYGRALTSDSTPSCKVRSWLPGDTCLSRHPKAGQKYKCKWDVRSLWWSYWVIGHVWSTGQLGVSSYVLSWMTTFDPKSSYGLSFISLSFSLVCSQPVNIAAIVAPSVIGGCLLILVIFLIVFFKVRDKRRLEGTYRPREEETEGTQKQPPSNLKLPPEERLI
uniref:Uncharacterized protein n=1 Tax=Erpetoichthys calabaricus TaxID=27687 RepID=A0A8C4T7J6_ERPCA